MLSRCVATDPQVFAAQYWGRRPLLSRSGALPRDFTDLLSPSTVDELIAERGVRAPFVRMAKTGDVLARECYVGSAGFGAEMPDQVDSAKLLAQFASGATIVLQGLHRLWPPLIDFVRRMVDDLGHPTQANAYITPTNSRGFDQHYDVHDVFVLQAAGQKRWIVHEPVHDDPLPSQPWTDHRTAITERVSGEPVIDTVLSAGDALYLPRGWIHSAQALDTTSIHLTIGVSALTCLDVVHAVVDTLATVGEFKKSLPIGINPADHDEMAAMATKIMAEVVDTMRHRAAKVATIDHHAGRVVLRLPDRTMTFPESCAPAVQALHRGLIADADSLPGLDRADATVLIRRLLREAVVVPADQYEQSISPGRG